MPKFNASNAECYVFTYKEGLLSAVAHDLRIKVTDFEVDLDEENGTVSGTFNAASLLVANAMSNGQDAPGKLGDGDKKKIEASILNDVLHSSKFPKITFESEAHREKGDGYQVKGTLSLHGQQKEIMVDVAVKDEKYVAEVTLNQPEFGIKPFSAMLGTLKIKPDVKIQLTVPKH